MNCDKDMRTFHKFLQIIPLMGWLTKKQSHVYLFLLSHKSIKTNSIFTFNLSSQIDVNNSFLINEDTLKLCVCIIEIYRN